MVAALASIAPGCGGSADPATLTKAQFIKRADSICEKSDKKQEAALRAYEKKNPNLSPTKPSEEKILLAVALPPVRAQAEELAALSPPEGDQAKVKAIVTGLEEALQKSEADPSPLLKGAGAFAGVEKLLGKYGFKGSQSCVNPL